MANNPITSTNLANYIPSIWSKKVLADAEAALVCGGLVDRSYEEFAMGGGNKIVVPNLHELTASVVNTLGDMSMYDTIQNVTNIDVNIEYDIGIAVDDIDKMQTNPKYFDKVTGKLAYSLAKRIDINVNALFSGFGNDSKSAFVAMTTDDIITAYEELNENNAPATDRAWVFDPETITDLLKLDYFVRMDYVPEGVHKTGFQGRSILGSPVYMTTNLDTVNVNCHGAAYFHREAIALVVQLEPKFEVWRWALRHSDAISGLILFGVAEMHDLWGSLLRTRS